MKKHNIPLNVLDEYAKTITSKQMKMLYENKLNKKYRKSLYENMKYQNDNSYNVYLDLYTLNEANMTIDTAIARYVNKYNLQYNKTLDGVYFYSNLEDNYIGLLENLVNDNFNPEALKNSVNIEEAAVFIDKIAK